MQTFPINLVLKDVPVLVVGGGAIAAEKLEKLVAHRPRLTVVSPSLAPATAGLVQCAGATWHAEPYTAAHLAGQRLVFAASNDAAVNRQVHADTRATAILVNAVDQPELCDFIMPAVVAGAHFTLAISTGGLAAGYARRWREQLEADLRREDDIVVLLDRVRALLKRKVDTFARRRDRLNAILDELEREP